MFILSVLLLWQLDCKKNGPNCSTTLAMWLCISSLYEVESIFLSLLSGLGWWFDLKKKCIGNDHRTVLILASKRLCVLKTPNSWNILGSRIWGPENPFVQKTFYPTFFSFLFLSYSQKIFPNLLSRCVIFFFSPSSSKVPLFQPLSVWFQPPSHSGICLPHLYPYIEPFNLSQLPRLHVHISPSSANWKTFLNICPC